MTVDLFNHEHPAAVRVPPRHAIVRLLDEVVEWQRGVLGARCSLSVKEQQWRYTGCVMCSASPGE
jgi:hypothetical protein